MNKKPIVYLSIIILTVLASAFFLGHNFDPGDFQRQGRMIEGSVIEKLGGAEYGSLKVLAIFLLVAICTTVIAVYYVRLYRRRSPTNDQNASTSTEDYLYQTVQITGKGVDEIFKLTAEDWSVPDDRVAEDFKRFLNDQSLPFYVTDFVRKNRKQIDDFQRVKPEPSTWWDWTRALLVFPGSFLFMVFMVTFLES
jgi:hypothetical protein